MLDMLPLAFTKYIHRFKSVWQTHGFGVQSPTAYRFLCTVLRETHPYYAYEDIVKLSMDTACTRSAKQLKLYFRLANHFQVSQVGLLSVEQPDVVSKVIQWAHKSACTHVVANITNLKESFNHYDWFFVSAQTLNTEELYSLVEDSQSHQVVIVEDLYINKESFQSWQELVDSPRVYQSFDLGVCGLLFFDSTKSKHHYYINL